MKPLRAEFECTESSGSHSRIEQNRLSSSSRALPRCVVPPVGGPCDPSSSDITTASGTQGSSGGESRSGSSSGAFSSSSAKSKSAFLEKPEISSLPDLKRSIGVAIDSSVCSKGVTACYQALSAMDKQQPDI